MKGNAKLVDKLNSLLADELTGINQYMVHAEMCEDWGYGKLSAETKRHAIDEMKHAEKLIERILFLEGTPIVSNLNKIHIGADVAAQVENDLTLELHVVKEYNEAIAIARDANDHATHDILSQILADEDGHVDYLEELQDQMDQLGVPLFLSTQK